MTAILRLQLLHELTGFSVVSVSETELARARASDDDTTRAIAELVTERRPLRNLVHSERASDRGAISTEERQ